MTATTRITGRDKTPCYYIWVAGVPVLYGSVLPPPKIYMTSTGPVFYERRKSIQVDKGFQFSRRMDVEDHVIQAAPVDVYLISDQQYSGNDASDPGEVFGRMGYAGATASAGLLAGVGISQTQAVPITVPVDSIGPAPFAVGDVVHIGREAFTVGAVAQNAPYSVTFNSRSIMGTLAQSHEYDTASGTRPVITKPAVYFRGRKAIIYENTIDSDGNVDDSKWVERWRGFLASEPEPGELGMIHTIRLRVSPLSAAIDRPLGKPNVTNFMSDEFHTFGTRKTNEAHQFSKNKTEVHFLELITQGSIYQDPGGVHTGDPSQSYYYLNQLDQTRGDGLPVRSSGDHSDYFDLNLPVGHPRRGPIVPNSPRILELGTDDRTAFFGDSYTNQYESRGVGFEPVENGILGTIPADPDVWGAELPQIISMEQRCIQNDPQGGCLQFAVVPVQRVNPDGGEPGWNHGWANANTGEWRVAELWDYSDPSYPQTHPWPTRLVDAIAAGWSSASTKGVRGGFSRVRFDNTDPMQPSFIFSTTDPVKPQQLHVALTNQMAPANRLWEASGRALDRNNPRPQHGHAWIAPGGLTSEKRARFSQRCVSASTVLLGEEEQVDEGVEPRSTFEVIKVTNDAPVSVPTRVARAFYQVTECFITVEREPLIPAGSTLLYRVFIGNEEDDPICTFAVESVQEVQVGNAVPVYVCTLKNIFEAGERALGAIKSFATYPGDPRVILEPSIRFTNETVGTLLLKLLCSSGGNSVTSTTFDTLPFGCGFTDGTTSASDVAGADLDVASFLRIPNPVNRSRISAQLLTGETVADVCVGLLRSVGYTLDIMTDDNGVCRLAAMPLGLPSVTETIANITESDIAENGISSPCENAIFNAFEFVTNFDPNGNAEPLRRTVVDGVSVNTFGEEKKLTIEMRGVELDEGLDFVGQLRPMFSRLRREFSFPRRLWKFKIRSGLATQMRLGGTYQVTHSKLRGVSGLGVSGALGRLRSVRADGWKSTAQVEFVAYGEGGTGWGPGADVTAVLGPRTVAVSTNVHSDVAHPVTGAALNDAGVATVLLQSGPRTVYVFTPGNMDNGTILSVSQVNTVAIPPQITFTGNHGLQQIAGESVHGYIIPVDYEPPEPHKDFAYIDRILVI